jgi:hypothetical protein
MMGLVMMGLMMSAALVAIAILLRALDTARDNEREALRQLADERALRDRLRDYINSSAEEERGIRSEAAKKGHQTRKRRQVVARVMQQDADIAAAIGGGQ